MVAPDRSSATGYGRRVASSTTHGSGGRLILLCGLAGAGKTTLAKRFEADGAVRMCPDEWLLSLGFDIYDRDGRIAVQELQWELTRALLLRGLTVVDESGMWQRAERDQRRAWAREHGLAVELHFLDAPVAELVRRVTERNTRLTQGEAHIEPGLIEFWSERLERPDTDELALFDPLSTPGAGRAGAPG